MIFTLRHGTSFPVGKLAVANEKIEALSVLCDEFQFGSLSQCLEAIKNTMNYRLWHRFARRNGNVQTLVQDVSGLTSRTGLLESAQLGKPESSVGPLSKAAVQFSTVRSVMASVSSKATSPDKIAGLCVS
jgi:hypothetical protein